MLELWCLFQGMEFQMEIFDFMNRNNFLIVVFFICLNAMGQNYSEELTKELNRHLMVSDLPGFSVAIVDGNQTLYKHGFGYADKEDRIDFEVTTIQNLGSVSKTVVGLALIKAIEDGKLTMDTEINEVLPFSVVNPFYKDSPILIRHLANHTSTIFDTDHYAKSYVLDKGFTDDRPVHKDFLEFISGHDPMELQDFLFKILNKEGSWYSKKNFSKSKPGDQKAYSNLNAALAAYIIEVVTELPFEEYTRIKIFEPLQMNFTSWGLEKNNLIITATPYFPSGEQVPRYRLITYPDGGLYSNIEDLSRYLKEMINAYSGNSDYLSTEFAKLLLPGDDDNERAFWGMGVRSRNIGHGGSDPGAQTDLQFNADRKIGRIILCNVNAEDNEKLYHQYRVIHSILEEYESRIKSK